MRYSCFLRSYDLFLALFPLILLFAHGENVFCLYGVGDVNNFSILRALG